MIRKQIVGHNGVSGEGLGARRRCITAGGVVTTQISKGLLRSQRLLMRMMAGVLRVLHSLRLTYIFLYVSYISMAPHAQESKEDPRTKSQHKKNRLVTEGGVVGRKVEICPM